MIIYDQNLVRQNEDDQTVFFTITDSKGNQYEWHCDMPKTFQIISYLIAHEEEFMLLIRRREYKYLNLASDVTVAEIDDYAARNNLAPIPFKSTHPKKSALESKLEAMQQRLDALEKKGDTTP